MKKKIKNKEIIILSNATPYEFPKYTTMLINQINQTAQATRPKIVGQMSELIQEFDGKTIREWEVWYNKRYPTAIEDATQKIYDQYQKQKEAMLMINEDLIREWVKDLIYIKTYCGLKFQQAILSYIANELNTKWRLSDKYEESKGIDGYIGDKPVQIKSETYKNKQFLNEVIDVTFVFYEKKKDGIVISYNEEDFR